MSEIYRRNTPSPVDAGKLRPTISTSRCVPKSGKKKIKNEDEWKRNRRKSITLECSCEEDETFSGTDIDFNI